jgi:hypothetical protein
MGFTSGIGEHGFYRRQKIDHELPQITVLLIQ